VVITSQEKSTLMELAMQKFVGTILVIVVCLAIFTSPVTAGDVLEPGDIAIIGYNSDDTSQFAFVCLKEITAGTVIYFTDNGWVTTTTPPSFRSGEGKLTWDTPGGCLLGQIVTINQYDLTMEGTFQLSNTGDQILVYQGSDTAPNFIFAINFEGTTWQGSASSANTSARPPGLDATNSVAIAEVDNAIYNSTKSFNTTADALAAIVNIKNWTGDNSVRQTMPTGSFSFTTTAVHLSEFSADSQNQAAPSWIIAGLVVIPILVMVLKRPKRNCCK
jgi:hypothetical protein